MSNFEMLVCVNNIFVIRAANFDAVFEWTNWVKVIQAVQICWFNENGIGADKYVSQLGN